MPRAWLEPEKLSIPASYTQSLGVNPMVGKILYQRGIIDPESARSFLYPEYYHPTASTQLPGLENLSEILIYAIDRRKKIGIWGDFDVDGQTATTLFVSAIREMGGNVIYHIPIRAYESHGINPIALELFLNQGVEIIVTCDTGISAHESVEYAKKHGVPVLITDHHDLPVELPSAEGIVNPKMLPYEHPLYSLPGVGVVYKVIEHVFHLRGEEQKACQYLDLVALGIVADIALQTGDTRYLLQQGLQSLRATQRAGLLEILKLVDIKTNHLTEEHISYILAPRMNALGRLRDANQIVELLTTSDVSRARVLALVLEGLNAQRKLLCDQVFQAAQAQLTNEPTLLDYPILVLENPNWPAGVIGIVASRLVEQHHRPVILLSSPPGENARGSARSIESVNITSIIEANRHFVKEYGGHPMAAGLSIDRDRIPEFRKALSYTIQKLGIEIPKENDLQIDGYITLPELSLDLANDLELIGPFGAGNPVVVLVSRNLRLTGYAAVGRNDEHLQLAIEDELGNKQRSIWWQGAAFTLPESAFDLAYTIRSSTYHGQSGVQVEWVDYRVVEPSTISVSSKKTNIEVIDLREEPQPVEILNQIITKESILIWGEADLQMESCCHDRFALYPSKVMAIWTIPPGITELRVAIQQVRPEKIYLFSINPGMDKPEPFLRRLSGLLKYCIKNAEGAATIQALAAATAQKTSTIKLGLDWLQARGYIHVIYLQYEAIRVQAGARTNKNVEQRSKLVQSALSESAAFRRYFLKADKDHLITQE
jgi:single-stranded-DNA-specific exonuclease